MTTTTDQHVVVVGASLAGTRAAENIRALGHTGRITLIGAEPELPYDRPPLSKDVLKSDWSEDTVLANNLASHDSLTQADIELLLGNAATALNTETHTITLADGSAVNYDTLVIATGAAARPSPWRPKSGVYQLRTLEDSRALAARLRLGEPLVVVGGGFIGTEIAAAAVGFGCDVTVIDPVPEPMTRIVGPEIASTLVQLHERHGATARFGKGVTDITGTEGNLTVHLDDGTTVETGAAVVGIGSIANTAWLEGSGLTVDNGVVTDGQLRAVGVDDVFAIGDVARWPHPGRDALVRAEHWTNASDQARFVATLLTQGTAETYNSNDYVWSDQYDWKVHTIGFRDAAGTSRIIGDIETNGKTAAVHLSAAGNVTGVVTVNWVRGLNTARRQLAAQASVDEVTTELQKLL